MTRRQDTHSMKVEQRVRKEQEKEQRRHSLPKGRKNKEQNVSSSYNSQKRKKKLFSEGLKDNTSPQSVRIIIKE